MYSRPWLLPVPFKSVSQILARKFIDLAELLSTNKNNYETEPQILFDSRRQITDIV